MEKKDYRLSAIMYTDIVGFSRLMEKNESATLEMLKYHNDLLTRLSEEHKGTVIKTVGDAFLVDFSNTVNAVKCAIAVQDELAAYNQDRTEDKLMLRIGVHLGDIYFFEDDALGEGINIASRLQSLAKPGRICISQDVYNLVHNKLDLRVNHLGEVRLKNISRGIHSYEIYTKSSPENEADKEQAQLDPDKIRIEGESLHKKKGEEKEDEAPVDFKELKGLVLQEIKRTGRRLSVDDIRNRLPFKSKGVDEVLESLADKGFLTRLEQQSNGTAYAYFDGKTSPGQEKQEWGSSWSSRGQDPPPRTPKPDQGRSSFHKELAEIRRQVRREIKEGLGQGGRSHYVRPRPRGAEDVPGLFEDYRRHSVRELEKNRKGFLAHLASYAGVNGFLFFIWLTTGAGFPWFLIPLLGWGIGIATNFVSVKRKEQENKELDAIPGMSRGQLRLFKKFQKNRDSFASHLASTVSVSVLLFTINMITSPFFPWFIFPVGGMGIGLLSHWPGFKRKERDLLYQLKDSGVSIEKTPLLPFLGRTPKGAASIVRVSRNQPVIEQAEQLKNAITDQLKGFGKDQAPLGEDIKPVLDNYIAQIKELDEKDSELEQIINSMPMGDLERDLQNLKSKLENVEDAKVAAEYKSTIEQIEKQQSSFNSLRNEKDIINLRLNSAVNSLKQMQIDLARMKSLSASGEAAQSKLIREKSQELSQYLEDLRSGYDELEE